MPIKINNKNNKVNIDHVNNNDIHLTRNSFTGTLTTTWNGTEPPYSQVVTVSGVLATDVPSIDMVNSGTYATDEIRNEEWANIYRAVTGTNSITFYSKAVTTVSIPFQVLVVRNNG
jgi:hypothetical protein